MLPAAIAVALGVVADRSLNLPAGIVLALAAVCAALAVIAGRRRMLSTLCVLGVLSGLGALRHHQVWSLRDSRDISRLALEDGTPVRMEGIVESPVELRRSEDSPSTPSWMLLDRSAFNLRVERVLGVSEFPASGLVRVGVGGHLPEIVVGDRVQVLGHIQIPGEPRDPEGFDLRIWLKSQGIDRAIEVEHPEAVVRLGDASGLWHRIARVRHDLRTRSEALLAENLGADRRAVGTSLLLGTRTGLTEEVREAFINSGTMHLLAISGLHVAILAGLVLAGCRLFGMGSGATVFVVIATLVGYTLITDLRPPVLRSAVLGCLMAAAIPGSRQTSGLNLLAGTAFVLLLWNPADLFDVGAQLSFLAVGAILWSSRWYSERRRRRTVDPLAAESTATSRQWRWLGAKIAESYVVTASIWLFTLPLTLAWFHLFSPIGFLINVVLVPFSGPLLATGFVTLATALIAPSLVWIPAMAYDLCLQCLMAVVRWAAGTPLAYVATPGPGAWQLAIFYGLLTAALLARRPGWSRRLWLTLGGAVAVMLLIGLRPRSTTELTVTFLDIGHGGAVLFEFPGGETALFDAGSFGRGNGATETIRRALEARRVHGLNALILSHADADHYNAAAGLVEQLPVAVVYVSQAFPDMKQRSVSELCESVVSQEVPLKLIQAGDSFELSADCTMEVMHPAGRFQDKLDNAHSIVLRTRFAGRTVLVTGDVEKAGVRAMLESHPAERIDVFQAPHHGGRMSNTTDLARWALPRYVVACNRDDIVLPHLKDIYADADRILTSAGQGTVTARIHRRGSLQIETTRGDVQR